MSDESVDDLVALYRQSAREAPPPRVDAHILRTAERARHVWSWRAAAALVASLSLGAVYHVLRAPQQASPAVAGAYAGYEEGQIAAYLMSMDVRAAQVNATERRRTDGESVE